MDYSIEELDEISQLALHHDDEEAITGDIPSPAKKKYFKDEYIHPEYRSNAHHIVKLADLIEATWFLSMEVKMGNIYVRAHLGNLASQTLIYAEENFGEDRRIKVMELMTSFKNAESAVI